MSMPMEDGPRGANIPKAELDRLFNDIVAQADVEDDILDYSPKKKCRSRKDNLLSDDQIRDRLKIAGLIALAAFCGLTLFIHQPTLIIQLVFIGYPLVYWRSVGRHLRPDHPTNEAFKAWAVVAMVAMAFLF